MSPNDELGPEPSGPERLLTLIQWGADKITLALNVIGTLLIVALMILIGADILGRLYFDAPISGVPELVSLSIVAIVFLQIAQAMRAGRLTRTEALLNLLQRRAPRICAALEIAYNLLAALLIWFLLEASAPLFVKSWTRDTFVGAVGDFTAPIWPVKLIILVGCVALIVQFVLAALRGVFEMFRHRVEGHPN